MARAAAGLAEGVWAEKATGLLAWEDRKQGQAWLSHHQASCLSAQGATAAPSHMCKPLTQTTRAAAGRSRSSAQCGDFRPSDSSLWLVEDYHECSFPSSTTPLVLAVFRCQKFNSRPPSPKFRKVDLHSPKLKTVCLIYQITKQKKE